MNNILRWIFFIPITFVSVLIATFLWKHLNIWTLSRSGFSENGLFFRFYQTLTENLIVGIVFVYVGSYIVPSFKKYVSIILSLFISIFSFYFCFIVNKEYGFYVYLEFISVLIGSIFTALTFYEGKNPEIY